MNSYLKATHTKKHVFPLLFSYYTFLKFGLEITLKERIINKFPCFCTAFSLDLLLSKGQFNRGGRLPLSSITPPLFARLPFSLSALLLHDDALFCQREKV